MGICPMSPQVRVINIKNKELLAILKEHLQQLKTYGFTQHLLKSIPGMQSRYLYNQGILEDIDKIHSFSKDSMVKRDQFSIAENIQEEIKNSCLILEDQNDLLLTANNGQQHMMDSFQKNLKKNQSLVVQINIIYSKEIKRSEYSQALQLFLKWAQMFQQHSYGGFLKPIYRYFCKYLYTLPKDDFSTIIDQICIFVQFVVSLVTQIYGLKTLAGDQNGKLIKNQNVYNLIMSYMFKRTKIKYFIVSCISLNEQNKINLFERQILRFNKRPTYFFGVNSKFTLQQTSMTQSEINKSIEGKQYVQPYSQSLKLLDQLCKNGSPVTKLKTIVSISKQIVKDIRNYYDILQKQVPDLDPDNLSSIVMYLIVKNNNKDIFEQLKIVQHFTTTNCLNCISGYYLNVFSAAIESILELQDE